MRKLISWLVPVAAAAAFFLGTEKAHAGDIALGVDLGVAVPTDNGLSAGFTADGRIGYRLSFGPVWLQPEGEGGAAHIGAGTVGKIGAGARFGLGGLLQPQVYAHAGAGFGDASGFLFDGGGALDLKVSLAFVGVHGGIDILSSSATQVTSGSLTWVDLGAHAGVLF